jgi:RNA polymerase sigma-70 factor (ECF subfamily)
MTPAELEAERLRIEQAKTDPQAFGELFDEYYDTIVRYVVRRTADVAVAQDITSEVFIKAFKHLLSFRWQGVLFSAWLYRIAMNELRMILLNRFRGYVYF